MKLWARYDDARQLTGAVWMAGTTTNSALSMAYDAANQLTGIAHWVVWHASPLASYQYGYDNAGNRTNTIAYSYDVTGRLIERRSSGNSVSTNRMYWAGWQMIADYDGADNTVPWLVELWVLPDESD